MLNTETNKETAAPATEREKTYFILSLFPGWYNSWMDQDLDLQIEQDSEYYANERDSKYYADDPTANFNFPDELKLKADEISEKYFDLDWSEYRESRNVQYVETLADCIKETIDYYATDSAKAKMWAVCLKVIADSLAFEFMTSPREYNFETDRLFAWGDSKAFSVMMKLARRRDNLADWKAFVRARHSSYDGFASFYPSDADDWPRDLADFDHNHKATLFMFALQQCGLWANAQELDSQILESMLNEENQAFYQNQIGDSTFETMRGEKLVKWIESDLEDSPDSPMDSPALIWIAANPAHPVLIAATEEDSAMVERALRVISDHAESITLPCDKTGELFDN